MLKSLFKIGMLVVVLGSLAACGRVVEVPPAHYGVILDENGYSADIIAPSKFRLPVCWIEPCPKIVNVQAPDEGMVEEFSLFMPKDQLTFAFDVRFTATFDKDYIKPILDRVNAVGSENDSYDRLIQFKDVYHTYGQPIIRTAVRQVLPKYTINEVASSLETINAELFNHVQNALKDTAIKLKVLSLANTEYPKAILEQKELAYKREVDIEREETEKKIRLIKLAADLEAAKAERAIRREKAEAAAEENAIFAKSVSREYLEYRKLEVLEMMAQNDNAVFVPLSALNSLGLEIKEFDSLPVTKEERKTSVETEVKP